MLETMCPHAGPSFGTSLYRGEKDSLLVKGVVTLPLLTLMGYLCGFLLPVWVLGMVVIFVGGQNSAFPRRPRESEKVSLHPQFKHCKI